MLVLLVQSVDKMTNIVFTGLQLITREFYGDISSLCLQMCKCANIADAVALLFATLRRQPIRILTH